MLGWMEGMVVLGSVSVVSGSGAYSFWISSSFSSGLHVKHFKRKAWLSNFN